MADHILSEAEPEQPGVLLQSVRAEHYAARIRQETLLMYHERQTVRQWSDNIAELWALAEAFGVRAEVDALLVPPQVRL